MIGWNFRTVTAVTEIWSTGTDNDTSGPKLWLNPTLMMKICWNRESKVALLPVSFSPIEPTVWNWRRLGTISTSTSEMMTKNRIGTANCCNGKTKFWGTFENKKGIQFSKKIVDFQIYLVSISSKRSVIHWFFIDHGIHRCETNKSPMTHHWLWPLKKFIIHWCIQCTSRLLTWRIL